MNQYCRHICLIFGNILKILLSMEPTGLFINLSEWFGIIWYFYFLSDKNQFIITFDNQGNQWPLWNFNQQLHNITSSHATVS